LGKNYYGITAQSPDAEFAHVQCTFSYCHGDLFFWNLFLTDGQYPVVA